MNHRVKPSAGRHGFLLLEVMIAVMIFAIGVIALGRCVENCLIANRVKEEGMLARRALENAMLMIEAGTVPVTESSSEELKGMFSGMRLNTKRTLLKEKNEKKQEITGVYAVTLEVLWKSGAEKQSRQLLFYHAPKPR